MELNKVFEFAVILAWEDLMKVSDSRSARVEYRCAPGTAVDYLSIWWVDTEGHQNMVSDYWTWTSPAHAKGIRFTGKFSSPPLGLALDFILMNQDQFTRPADACPEGLALIYPPTENEHTEAASWLSHVHGAVPNVSRTGPEQVAAV